MKKSCLHRLECGQGVWIVVFFMLCAAARAGVPVPAKVSGHDRRSSATQANRAPARPVNIEPRNGSKIHFQGPRDTILLLHASPFKDPDRANTPNGRPRYSQWVVTTSSQAGAAILDSGPTTRTQSIFLLRRGLLKSGTTYFWSVRYADASAQAETMWSPWSAPTKFSTEPEVIKELSPATLRVSAVKPGDSIYLNRILPVIIKAPCGLGNQPLILTRSGDALTSGPGTLISFKSDLPLSVYVAYDDRATTLPQWLWSFAPYPPPPPPIASLKAGVAYCPLPPALSRERNAFKLYVTDRAAPLRRLLVRDFATTETVALGNNLPDPALAPPTTVTLQMYSVIVQPRKK